MTKLEFGIFCTNGDLSLSTNHTLSLSNLNLRNLIRVFSENARDLISLLDLCKRERIKVFRLGSNFIPFRSHPAFREEWIKHLEPLLQDLKVKIKKQFPDIRITMHPGQYVVLNSPRREIVESSLRELEYHFWLLDFLERDSESVVIVHGGGTYGDKQKATERLMETIEKNAWLKKRIALENDERAFGAEDILKICGILKIPMVFDHYHHKLNPSEFDIGRVFETWGDRRTPKVHLSSGGRGKRGSHAEYIEPEDFLDLCHLLSRSEIQEIHIMLEAKRKERAYRKLMDDLRKLSDEIRHNVLHRFALPDGFVIEKTESTAKAERSTENQRRT